MSRRRADIAAARHDTVEWRPRLIAVDLDATEAGGWHIEVPPDCARAWVEARRRGRVVGVRELRPRDGRLSPDDLERLASDFPDPGESPLANVPTGSLPTATVVMCTIARDHAALVRSVQSLFDLDYPAFDVVVVDNRGRDGDAPLPALPGGERVRVVVEPRRGISAARNRGIAEATGELVCFTDDDVVVDRGWLRAIGARFALDPDLAGVGGLVLPLELETVPQLWFEEFYGGFTRSFDPHTWRTGLVAVDDAIFPYAAGRFGAGCNMGFRRSALDRFGGFDVALGTGTPAKGGEDLAMFVTLLANGATVGFEPEAVVRHSHRRTREAFLAQVRDYGIGLTAMYSSLVVADRRHARGLLRRVPAGLRLLLTPRDARSPSRSPSYPRRTLLVQIGGMLRGPTSYLASRRFAARSAPPRPAPALQPATPGPSDVGQPPSPTMLPDAQTDRLLRSATALLISNGTGALLGFGFWAAAARLYNTSDVGSGVIEVSMLLLISTIAQLNLGIIFPRFLFAAGAKATAAVRMGYAASMTTGVVLAGIFLLVRRWSFIPPGVLPSLFFLVAVVLWVVFSIQDAALIGLRTTFWVPVENTSFSIAKILLLPAFVAVAPNQGVMLSWVLPVLVCIGGITTYLFTRVLPDHVRWSAGRSSLPGRRAVGAVVSGEYLAGLAYVALATLPAFIVGARLGKTQAAYFQTPWLAGTSVDFMLYYVATSVIAEASARTGDVSAIIRRAVRFTIALLTPATIVLIVAGHWLLLISGAKYSAHGTKMLELLACGFPLLGVNVLYMTFARLARRVRRIVLLPIAGTVIILVVSTVLLPRYGITAVGIGFLVGQGTVAAVVLPSVIRQYRRPGMSPGFAPDRQLVVKGDLPLEPAAEVAFDATSEPAWHRHRARGIGRADESDVAADVAERTRP